MTDTLTIDQAAEIDIAEAPAANIVPASPPAAQEAPLDDYSELIVPDSDDSPSENLPYAGDGLTIDEAARIPLADDHGTGNAVTLAGINRETAAIVDGQPLTLFELVKGYRLGRDIERHHQDLRVAADAVVASAEGLADHLLRMLPAKPSAHLAYTDPAAYTAAEAIHDAAYQNMSAVIDQAKAASEVAGAITYQRHAQALWAENVELTKHFPETADPEGREAFFDRLREVAYACDFSETDMRNVTDHRIFRLAFLALKGLEAMGLEKPRAKSSRKERRQYRKQVSDAMARLMQTGSIDDAVEVDFD